MRVTSSIAALFVLTTVGQSLAQCPDNPNGGPTLIQFRGSNTGAETDLDLGTSGSMHNIEVPGLRVAVCLANCDASTDPACTVESVRSNAEGHVGITTPMPLDVAGVPICVALRFPTPLPASTGAANVQTGDISFDTSVEARIFTGGEADVCPTCIGGLCQGGVKHGSPCAVERTVTVFGNTYDLSFECQPSGSPLDSLTFPVSLTTGSAAQSTCPSQAAGDACGVGSVCDQTVCTPPTDGKTQNCCSLDLARSCFPEAGVSRQGLANPPIPAWPSTTYPKNEKSNLVSTTCAPAAGATTSSALGLPGPAALHLHVLTDWLAVDTTTTTSTSSTTLPTLPGNCTPPTCDDDNVCTTDSCTDMVCGHDLQAGIPGVRCLIDRMRTRPLCEGATVDAKLDAGIDKALAKADRALMKADTATGNKRAKKLKKASKQLSRIFRKADKAKTKGKLTDECHNAITGRTGSIKAALSVVQ